MHLWNLLICIFFITAAQSSKFTGQRIFNDFHMIDFIDPAKHGFHIILHQQFVDTHLQATKLPTVFASAIPLKRAQWGNLNQNESKSYVGVPKSTATRRVTKVLYPENGGPEDGLLDGRTIKLLGLQERSWYYICLEFESNLNRHEMATGLTCELKRTLDKFGKSTESTVTEVELLEIGDRSITIQLSIDVDFALSLTVFLDQNTLHIPTRAVPAQTFILNQSRLLNLYFGPYLDPDTSYGRLCILEEPVSESMDVYTAMGRAARATLEHCYFDDLKTKSSRLEKSAYQEHGHMAEEPSRHVGHRISSSCRCQANFIRVFIILVQMYICQRQ